jgi:hypothetical protein
MKIPSFALCLRQLACVAGLLAAAAGTACAQDEDIPGGSPSTSAAESSYAAEHGFAFAVLGNASDRAPDEKALSAELTQIGNEADLVIHTGNIKGRNEPCDDTVYSRRHALLRNSPVPLVYTPGEYDWAECDRQDSGQFSPIERLSRLRDLFFDPPRSLGLLTLDLQRQSETVRFRGYPENARWEYGGILFVTLNVPDNHNNFRTAAGRNGEYEERVQADDYWLRQAFMHAEQQRLRGLVVAFRADPHLTGKRDTGANGGDAYASLKAELAKLAAKYPGEVLIAHGTSGAADKHLPDHPLRLGSKVLDNVTRIRTYDAPNSSNWIKVSVTPGRKNVFRVETAR